MGIDYKRFLPSARGKGIGGGSRIDYTKFIRSKPRAKAIAKDIIDKKPKVSSDLDERFYDTTAKENISSLAKFGLGKDVAKDIPRGQISPMKTIRAFGGEARAESYYGDETVQDRQSFSKEELEKYAERDEVERYDWFGILKTELDHRASIKIGGLPKSPANLKTEEAVGRTLMDIIKETPSNHLEEWKRQGGRLPVEKSIIRMYQEEKITQPQALEAMGELKKLNFESSTKSAMKMASEEIKQKLLKFGTIGEKAYNLYVKGLEKGIGYLGTGVGYLTGGTLEYLKTGDKEQAQKQAEISAQQTQQFGEGVGKLGAEVAPVAYTAPILLSGALLYSVGKDVQSAAEEAGIEYETSKNGMIATETGIRAFGSKGLEKLGISPEKADEFVENPILAGTGIFVEGLFTYMASKGITRQFSNALIKNGKFIEGKSVKLTTDQLKNIYKNAGKEIPADLPQGTWDFVIAKGTTKAKLLSNIGNQPGVFKGVNFTPSETLGTAETQLVKLNNALTQAKPIIKTAPVSPVEAGIVGVIKPVEPALTEFQESLKTTTALNIPGQEAYIPIDKLNLTDKQFTELLNEIKNIPEHTKELEEVHLSSLDKIKAHREVTLEELKKLSPDIQKTLDNIGYKEVAPKTEPKTAEIEVKPTKVVEVPKKIEKQPLIQEAKKYKTAQDFIEKVAPDVRILERGKYIDIWEKANEDKIAEVKTRVKTRKISQEKIDIVNKEKETTRLKADIAMGKQKIETEIIKIDKELDVIASKGAGFTSAAKISSAYAQRENKSDILLSRKDELQKALRNIKPEVKKPVKEKTILQKLAKPTIPKPEIKLRAGADIGIDEFIAQDIKPTVNNIAKYAKASVKVFKQTSKWITNIFEPALPVSRKQPEIFAKIIRGIHRPERKNIEFNETKLKTIDSNYRQFEEFFNKYPKRDLEALMLSRGTPQSAEGNILQQESSKVLPEELKKVRGSINDIANSNYDYLTRVVGSDVSKVVDYFYGIYKNPAKVTKFLDHWQSTKKFTKEKTFPSYADARAYGLELRSNNPVTNLRSEFLAIARLQGMKWMKGELDRLGVSKEELESPLHYESINDVMFKGLRYPPEVAKLVNSLISTNKVSQYQGLRMLRAVNNFSRQLKFVGSAFHLMVEAKQAIADTRYLGFLSPTVTRGITRGFKKDDKIFKTAEYRDYVELGGGKEYSIEYQALQSLKGAFNKIYSGNYMGGLLNVLGTPAKIFMKDFPGWMFESYIPRLKYSKYLDNVAKLEKKFKRQLTDNEKINIIKEGQNFYGEMNERLFGRSGTVTSLLRFAFMAPGFGEGNFRTIAKSYVQWGKGKNNKKWEASRSRANKLNSYILTGILATIGTAIMTGAYPKRPKTLEDVRDLFKIDTGMTDDKGKDIMIDLMTYEKDYWDIDYHLLTGRPDKVINLLFKRIGGMKAATAGTIVDMTKLIMGEKIVDWKGDELVNITDPFLLKLQKYAIHEIKRFLPISANVYKQLRDKGVNKVMSFVGTASGIRPTKTEEQKRIDKVFQQIYSLKGQQEELYQYLRTIKEPRKSVNKYNKKVNEVLDNIPEEIASEWESKLIIDTDSLLKNKLYQFTNANESAEDQEKLVEYLKNFEVSYEDAKKMLKDKMDNKLKSAETKNERLQRFDDRWK